MSLFDDNPNEWLEQIKNKKCKTLTCSEINYFKKCFNDYGGNKIMFAIKEEFEEDFSIAKSDYKDYYESIKEELTGYKLIEAKKFFEKKISQMSFQYAYTFFKKKRISLGRRLFQRSFR